MATAGAVPEIQDFDQTSSLIQPVVDDDGRMLQLADTRPARDGCSHSWKSFEKSDMIQHGESETFRQFRKIRPGIFENLFQIG